MTTSRRRASAAISLLPALGAVGLLLAYAGRAAAPPAPENLARRATASATSEYSGAYLAAFAVDGKVPGGGSQADTNQAWCVNGATHGKGADLTLTWPEPVTVAQVVYYGRTAWFAEECWSDCTLFVDGSDQPLATFALKMGHGPQPLNLPRPVSARRLTLRFASSFAGMNPGASEIEVYAEPTSPGALGKFVPLPPGTPIIEVEPPEAPELAARLKGLGCDSLVLIRRHEINCSHVYTYHTEGFQPGGALSVLSLRDGSVRDLVQSPEGEILDCDVSWDGRTILFSWRRTPEEGYHLYTIRADGSGLRQLTRGDWHDYNACWLPDGGIAFLSTRSARFAYCWISPVGILHRMSADGTGVRRLSANIVNDFTPAVMSDGRIIYSRWEYVDKPAIPIQSLWTIRPDGTALEGFYGNGVLSPATFMEAQPIPGSRAVLCTLTSHNGPARGATAIVSPVYGVNSPLAIRNLTPEVNIGRVDRGDGNSVRGPFENPYPLDEEAYLVSMRGRILLRRYDAQGAYTVIDRPGGGLGWYSPRPLRPRPRPVTLPQLAPRPAEGDWAVVTLSDVYQGMAPEVRRGEVRSICVVEEVTKNVRTDVSKRAFGFQFPVISCGATYACKRVWGWAPVAEDGSATFRVPSGRPIYFMALDAQGRALQRMRTFTHLMPGERQGCVGCHEPRGQTPLPGRGGPQQPASLHKPWWGQGVGFDYSRIVQPILDRRCGGCHSPERPAGGVDLSGDKTDFFNVSYETLARGRRDGGMWDNPYTSWIPTYNGFEANILQNRPRTWGSPRSRLADIVIGGHPDASGQKRLSMPFDERQAILTWIDLNVPYYGTSETAYPDNEGCRRMVPSRLEPVLAEVAARRCAGCHKAGIPREAWYRVTRPERNPFLTAPLAHAAGGTQRCGQAVFADRADPDYRAILSTFDEVTRQLADRPRMDMPGATPAVGVSRACR
jgi:mono/diheme cytochrome c family protein